MDSDDDETAKTGFEDDEEIDSDLADTDHEEPKPAKAKIAKPISNRRKVSYLLVLLVCKKILTGCTEDIRK